MSILWRLLAPKPLKKARRATSKALHPVRTTRRAVTPKTVKKVARAAHPLDWAELKAEDAIVSALRGGGQRRRGSGGSSPAVRSCGWCGSSFTPTSGGQRYCGLGRRDAQRQARKSGGSANPTSAQDNGPESVGNTDLYSQHQPRAWLPLPWWGTIGRSHMTRSGGLEYDFIPDDGGPPLSLSWGPGQLPECAAHVVDGARGALSSSSQLDVQIPIAEMDKFLAIVCWANSLPIDKRIDVHGRAPDDDMGAATFGYLIDSQWRLVPAAPGVTNGRQAVAQAELVSRLNACDAGQVRRAAAVAPGDVEVQCRVADADMADGRPVDAFDLLLDVMRRTSGTNIDQARRHLIALFDVLPPGDRRVAQARSTLASLLS